MGGISTILVHFKNLSDADADLTFGVTELKISEIWDIVVNEQKTIAAWRSRKTQNYSGEKKACKSYFRLIWLIVGWNTEWVIKLYLYFEASQSIPTL